MGPFLHTSGLGRFHIPPPTLFCVRKVDTGHQNCFVDWLDEDTIEWRRGILEIKDGGVMIFNQFTLIACWLLAQLYNCKLFVVCCLYSLSLFILSHTVTNQEEFSF